MKIAKWLGIAACLTIIASCFMHWAWYPDLQKYFTGFFTEKNYYGRPGLLLSFVGCVGLLSYLLPRVWLQRLSLIMAGIGLGYAIKTVLLYTSGYDGYKPQAQPALYVMLVAMVVHLIFAARMLNSGRRKKKVKD